MAIPPFGAPPIQVTGVTPGTYTATNLTVNKYGQLTAAANGSGAGGGTVTTVSVVTANGISGTVATASTTPAITLSLGAITPTTVNGLTITSTTGTLTIASGKTLKIDKTLEFDGTDSTVMTFPSTSATIARTDAANTFTGHQTIEGVTTTGATGTGKLVFDGTPTLITPVLGVASATTINKVTITAPATGSTLTINDGFTLTASGNATVSGTNTGDQTITLTGNVTGSGTGSFAATIATSVALAGSPTTTTQTSSDNSTKIATTAYVTTGISNAIAAVNPAVAVQAATTAAGNTSGLTYLPVAAGIGDTFTGSVNTAIVFDGHTLVLGDRVLIKNDTQTSPGAVTAGTFNGVYTVTQVQTVALPPILTRASDYNQPSDINNTGAIPVLLGTVNGITSWILTTTVTAVGTGANPLTYAQFSYGPTTVIPPNLGGTGVANNAASTITISGSFATTLTVSNTTSVTLPTAGTLATRAGSEPLTNKDLTGAGNTFPTFNQNTTGSAGTLSPGRTIGGVSFDGSTNITVASATGGFTVSGGVLAVNAGITASGATSNDFSGGSGTFKTSTGANQLSGAVTISDATTPSLTTASGKTNTGFLQINGKTSGALKIITADATAQTITISSNAQTVGATTLTIPDFASVSDTFAFISLAQSLTNKNLNSGTNTFPTFNQNTTGSAAKWTTARLLAGNSVDGSADVAFANKFVVQGTTDSGLSAAQFLGALGTGIVKNTTTTGVLSIAVAGDFPTLNQNTTGSAATLTTPRTIGGVSFDGSVNITVATATGGFTVSGGDLAIGANNLTITGSIGSTGSRVTKGWFTDLQVTNAISGSVTGNAAGLSATLVPASGGTGVANNNSSTLTISGAFGTTLTVSSTTTLTLPTSGTLATLAGAETLTNKLVSDAFMGNAFQSQSATLESPTLLTSTDFVYNNILEIGATKTLEIPATSTLEVAAYVNASDPNLTLKTLTDTFMGDVFDNQSGTVRNITLDANKSFIVPESLEIGGGFTLEIPLTSTIEVTAPATLTGGAALTKKIIDTPTVRNWDGWQDCNETWAFSSATVILVPQDATQKYDVGDKIKLTQSGAVAYFYIVAVAAGQLTITGGSDYTFANAAITSNFYSKEATPHNFPQYFNYTPTYTGFSSAPSTAIHRFTITGRMVDYNVCPTSTGTSNTTAFTVSLPVTASAVASQQWSGHMRGADNGSYGQNALYNFAASATAASIFKDMSGAVWTASLGKAVQGHILYEI